MYSAIGIVDQLSESLSIASLKHRVIANNIANRDTAGYTRSSVVFNSIWDSYGTDGRRAYVVRPELTSRSSLPNVQPSLEADMLALSANALHYQSLVKALNRQLSISSLIASGGRF